MIDAFVLIGGESRRMGRDKARAAVASPWGTLPLAVRVVEVLRSAGARSVALIRRVDDGQPWVDHEGASIDVYEDGAPSPHPLWGVAAALTRTQTDRCLVASGDSVGLSVAAARRMLEAGPCVAMDAAGGRHPTLAVWPAAHLGAVRGAAERGASARSVATMPGLLLPPDDLRDADEPSDLPDDPVVAAVAGLPVPVSDRALAGERWRLRARGVR